MNNNDFVSLYTHSSRFDDEHSVLKTFEIYAKHYYEKGVTRIIITNADTKREAVIYFDYILREENRIIEAAKALIDTNLLI